ncbi:ACP S-malonyltransferase [Paenibacillus massiliensis]|uniref:ACP S-malonyltransferase n=1 Tax=Paenibacillus massiliensis TaxID=225917 RepID=UPI0004727CA6|nr:ACP S-malonyltransferase [Paenibacillus massiliensis]
MDHIALFFPGQGSQYVGMGLHQEWRTLESARLFEEASDILHFDVRQLCEEGPHAQLMDTAYTQPALLTVSYIAFMRYWEEVGVPPAYCAGHSLGEYSALVSSGALTFAEGLRVVSKRGQYMKEAAEEGRGMMLAIRGHLSLEDIQSLLDDSKADQIAVLACHNSHEQYVLSGHHDAITSLATRLNNQGIRATRLQVSGPFHSPLMSVAATKLAEDLKECNIQIPKWPVISNVTALPYLDVDDIQNGLVAQMTQPVQWVQTIDFIANQGVGHAVELGPGTVLRNLVGEMTNSLRIYSSDILKDWIDLKQQFSLQQSIVQALSLAASTPNYNRDEEEYYSSVTVPVQRLKRLLEDAGSSREHLHERRIAIVQCLRSIILGKRLPAKEEELEVFLL